MNDDELHVHLERGLENLRREFADTVPAEHVTLIGRHHFETLLANAKINDFIPLLVCCHTREALLRIRTDSLDRAPTAPRVEVGSRILESVSG